MNAAIINPILQSFVDVLPQIGFQTVQKQAIALADSRLANTGILLTIGVVGTLHGAILIGMDIAASKRFASKMMMGMPIEELNDMAQSAVSEMGNMVCATACTRLSQAGVTGLDITPPVLLIGGDSQIELPMPKVLQVQLLADDIAVDVYVGLKAAG